MKTETLPDGAEQKHEYTANGAENKFIDPTEEDTRTVNDLLGRPLRRTYKDGTIEVVEWEGTRIKSVTDRQGRKQTFGYNSKGQVTTVSDPTGIIDRLAYDSAGRLQSWTNKDSEITWSDFDLEGRPKRTTQKRFRNASGLETTPAVLDVYTQEHRWNEHGERTSWSMPAYAGQTPGAGWTRWLREEHDAMGNVTVIRKVDGPDATEGPALMVAAYRNAGRPDHRMVYAGAGAGPSVPIVRNYGYNPETSLLKKLEVSAKGLIIAGSDVQHDGLQVMDAKLLGLSSGERYTKYDYDDRSRVRASLFGTTNANADPRVPIPGQASEDLTAADFRRAQARVQQVPGTTTAGDPPSKTMTERGGGGHKIAQLTRGPLILPYGYNGSEVVDDGRFTYDFNAKGRLISATEKSVGAPKRRALYTYSGSGRLVGRRAEYATVATPQPADWKLEDRTAIIRADGLPAETTFVWDAITDRLVTVAKAGASSTDPHGGLLKQIIHGGSAYDDPLETATIDPDAPSTVNYLYPIYDEAGAGSLQAVLNKRGELVGRNLSNDPFGGEELDLTGGAVDRARVTAKKNAQGELTSVTVDIRSTEAISANTVAGGVRLATIDANARVRTATATPELADANTVRWTMSASEWATFTREASTLSVAVTNNLRAAAWSADLPILAAPDWAVTTGRATTTPEFPVEIRESVASLDSFISGIPAGAEQTTRLYEVESLALLGTRAAPNQIDDVLSARMHAHPFTDPLTNLDYVRERWYQPISGSWLTPDPMGYRDSPNMYAFAGGDPVNGRDPEGLAASVSKSGVIIGIRPDGSRYRIQPGTDPVLALRMLESDPDLGFDEQEDLLKRARMAIPYSSALRPGESAISSGKPNYRAFTHAPKGDNWVKNAIIATSGLPPQNRQQQLVQGGLQLAGTVALVAGGTYGNRGRVSAQPVFETRVGKQVGVNDFMVQKARYVSTVRVYRVEGPANARVTIGPNGEVTISDADGMLFLNFGDSMRAQQFFAKRLGQKMFGVSTKSFEVPRWFMLQLAQEAVPQAQAGEFPSAPQKVDPNQAPNQYGLRPSHVDSVRGVIVPGSGRDR